MNPPGPQPGTTTRLARNMSFGALLSLMLLLVVWYGWLVPPTLSFWPALLALFLLPLVLPLRGMVAGEPQPYIKAGLLALLYFCHGVMEVFGSPQARWPAMVEVALSLILFIAALTFARLRRDELTAAGEARTRQEASRIGGQK